MSFRAAFSTANNNTVGFIVMLETITSPLVVVHGKFSGRRDDKNACALFWRKISLAK